MDMIAVENEQTNTLQNKGCSSQEKWQSRWDARQCSSAEKVAVAPTRACHGFCFQGQPEHVVSFTGDLLGKEGQGSEVTAWVWTCLPQKKINTRTQDVGVSRLCPHGGATEAADDCVIKLWVWSAECRPEQQEMQFCSQGGCGQAGLGTPIPTKTWTWPLAPPPGR